MAPLLEYQSEWKVASCHGCKSDQTIIPPTPCLTVSMRGWCHISCPAVTLPNMTLVIVTKHLHFGLTLQRTLFQRSCGWVRSNFSNLRCATTFYLETRTYWIMVSDVSNIMNNAVQNIFVKLTLKPHLASWQHAYISIHWSDSPLTDFTTPREVWVMLHRQKITPTLTVQDLWPNINTSAKMWWSSLRSHV